MHVPQACSKHLRQSCLVRVHAIFMDKDKNYHTRDSTLFYTRVKRRVENMVSFPLNNLDTKKNGGTAAITAALVQLLTPQLVQMLVDMQTPSNVVKKKLHDLGKTLVQSTVYTNRILCNQLMKKALTTPSVVPYP